MAKKQGVGGQRGFFIAPGFIIIFVVLLVIGGIGFFVYNKNKKPAETLGSTSQQSQTPTEQTALKNFYDCFELDSRTYVPGKPNKCVAHGKTFNEPTSFTYDDVRDADKLPAGVRGQVFSDASANFYKCAKQDQEDESNVPVTQVLSVLGDDWTYVALSCQDSSTEIYQKQADSTWLRINKTTSKIACAVSDQYQIPKELFLTSANADDHDTTCVKADGGLAQIPYTYKPSGINDGGSAN